MQPELEIVLTATARLAGPIAVGQTPQGLRRVVPILGGTFEGPKLRGEILGGGADWQYTRSDGVTVLEALYLLRTHDGTVIQVCNRGLRHGPPEIMQLLAQGQSVDPSEYYFRAAPEFSAPQGPYDWLNKSLFLCTGVRHAAAVELKIYRVT